MKTYNVYLTYKNGDEDETQVCGKNLCDAMNVVYDFVQDCGLDFDRISTCLLEQCYNADDAAEYGDEYEC